VPALSGWSTGTALGIVVGNVLPGRAVSALSVALFGMFLAIIVPPARENRVVLGCVIVSFAASLLFSVAPLFASWSAGTRTILLTVIISSAAALLFPVSDDELGEEASDVA
jgi:predicted branched-subunit amino acid permease